MTDRPILFSAPMVRALLEGRKTQTRRLAWREMTEREDRARTIPRDVDHTLPTLWQRVKTGDMLWVRESLRQENRRWHYQANRQLIEIERSDPRVTAMIGWAHHQERDHCVSIHMPRWASRISLEVTAVRVQRLKDISEGDALAEGIEYETADPGFWYVPGILPHRVTAAGIEEYGASAAKSYAKLWNYLHGADAWNANPEVVALTFTVHKQNIDALLKQRRAA